MIQEQEEITSSHYLEDIRVEFIICAAVWFNDGKKYLHQPKNIESGFVVLGRRHHNCFSSVQNIGVALGYNKTVMVKKGFNLIEPSKQGFLTSQDRFVGRTEAAEIAHKAKQINKPLTKLFSEDIY